MDRLSIPTSAQAFTTFTTSVQEDTHLSSGDSVWILTDVEVYESSFYAFSKPQEIFKVGVYDLKTRRIGFATFGRDTAFALLKAGLTPPPWTMAQSFGIALHRQAHDQEHRGRYRNTVELVPIDPALLSIVAPARAMFARMDHWPNAYPGIWEKEERRAIRERAIESAALGMVGPFGAGDVRKVCGASADEVSRVLKRLVSEGKLLAPTGTKRGTKYQVAPK